LHCWSTFGAPPGGDAPSATLLGSSPPGGNSNLISLQRLHFYLESRLENAPKMTNDKNDILEIRSKQKKLRDTHVQRSKINSTQNNKDFTHENSLKDERIH
jgi:hypothetical protein